MAKELANMHLLMHISDALTDGSDPLECLNEKNTT